MRNEISKPLNLSKVNICDVNLIYNYLNMVYFVSVAFDITNECVMCGKRRVHCSYIQKLPRDECFLIWHFLYALKKLLPSSSPSSHYYLYFNGSTERMVSFVKIKLDCFFISSLKSFPFLYPSNCLPVTVVGVQLTLRPKDDEHDGSDRQQFSSPFKGFHHEL